MYTICAKEQLPALNLWYQIYGLSKFFRLKTKQIFVTNIFIDTISSIGVA